MQGVVPSVFMLQENGMDHYSLPLFYRYLVFHTFSLYHYWLLLQSSQMTLDPSFISIRRSTITYYLLEGNR